MTNAKYITAVLLALSVCASSPAALGQLVAAVKTIAPLIKTAKALPDSEIVSLAKLGSKSGGTREISIAVGKLNLPSEVIEDTYARIAIQQGKLSRADAEGVLTRLQGTPGLRSTLSKIAGASDVKTSGHLNELKIADAAAQHRFKVKGIGVQFNDQIKSVPTDIDVLIERGGKTFAIEAKDYAASTPIPLDAFRADMNSLAQYVKLNPQSRVIPVFSLTRMPTDALAWKILSREADKRGVQLIVGTPEQQIIQLRQLQEIL